MRTMRWTLPLLALVAFPLALSAAPPRPGNGPGGGPPVVPEGPDEEAPPEDFVPLSEEARAELQDYHRYLHASLALFRIHREDDDLAGGLPYLADFLSARRPEAMAGPNPGRLTGHVAGDVVKVHVAAALANLALGNTEQAQAVAGAGIEFAANWEVGKGLRILMAIKRDPVAVLENMPKERPTEEELEAIVGELGAKFH